ncbi:hypothetical protein [Haloferax gibbonsii]|uniref:hypothetical protein n=1 Tax=Haloferax gibbonsii TaxID=35746 RepID=UPI001EFA02C8|nr:hypothetical protein [Haloferax gibbonsii]
MTGWKSSSGISADTALVKLYPPETRKEAWRVEAEERGALMSQYLQDLAQEARYLREQGQVKLGDKRKAEQYGRGLRSLSSNWIARKLTGLFIISAHV